MKIRKILVLGNGPSINDIDFDKIDKDIITIGTNRIWLKYIPNMFYFHDPKIFQELNSNRVMLNRIRQHSKIITSDWLTAQCAKSRLNIPHYCQIYSRVNRRKFPDCVTTAIEIYDRRISSRVDVQNVYYLSGVHLKWYEESHFWKKNKLKGIGHSQCNEEWYEPRFKKVIRNFKNLKNMNYKIISTTEDSSLNSIFKYEPIESLYV